MLLFNQGSATQSKDCLLVGKVPTARHGALLAPFFISLFCRHKHLPFLGLHQLLKTFDSTIEIAYNLFK